MSEHTTVLVTGATGNVGRRLVPLLAESGVRTRALTRRPRSASADPPPEGVEIVGGDLTDSAGWRDALDDVDAVFLLWPFFTADGAAPVIEAVAERVPRIVYLSSSAVLDDRLFPDGGVWGRVERLVERSGAEWTFLRAGGFAANTLQWAGQIKAGDTVRAPYGRAARSLIHEADIAEVAARTLTESGHAGRRYVLTGPETITQHEQVRIIGEAIGRALRWEEQPPQEARAEVAAFMGEELADRSLAYWASLVERPEPVTTTVERVTGRPARPFREWAREHAADFTP
ncbi:SDR family oxidoreductase [Thermomonospora catenispora]|uniref:SDR family oxidoreductase n=1 Tax=Thermomonospora catenispora TaxID=2493090 RepID=UPI001122E74E|nr:NAD(P)H-binding protein [Thermomonospora catenispora]TNY37827.1 NAD-dependent epimerase/dehydratase family protein [Thermomonospora catenispora]